MRISLSRARLSEVLPDLLEIWPADGSWTSSGLSNLYDLIDANPDKLRIGKAKNFDQELEVSLAISKARLSESGKRVMGGVYRPTPWKYTHHFDRGPSHSYNVLKIRPGSTLPLSLNGVDTTAHVNTVRRLNFRGNPRSLLMNLSVDVSEIPVRLVRETKCFCEYCGRPPVSDETSCNSCGAPLPPC